MKSFLQVINKDIKFRGFAQGCQSTSASGWHWNMYLKPALSFLCSKLFVSSLDGDGRKVFARKSAFLELCTWQKEWGKEFWNLSWLAILQTTCLDKSAPDCLWQPALVQMGHPADDVAAHSLNYCHTSQSVCSAQPQVGNKLVNHCQWCSSKALYTEISLKLFFIIVCPFSMGRIHFLLKWGQQRGWKEDEGLISWCPAWNIQYILFYKVRITLFFPFFTPHDSPHRTTQNTFSNSLSLSCQPLQGTKTLYPTGYG